MHVLCGAPQGSVLGLTIFIIFINDAPSIISSKSTLYAENLKLLGPALSCEDHAMLPKNLQLLGQWAEAWFLEFNVAKCHIIYFGKLNPCCSYFFLGHLLSFINSKQDLGVNIDNEPKLGTYAEICCWG
ncbi:uncharacterized protein LOC136032488 [Artemia franciscana]|uniref:uncharacterized protein LOC136032488 n=1 Tax=Artemia franciscana TaxID=6661 RepID=UPI0032DAA352